MTIKRVQKAAFLRGIEFDGEKIFRNMRVGCAYEMFMSNGKQCFQSPTLEGLYNKIMEFKKVR